MFVICVFLIHWFTFFLKKKKSSHNLPHEHHLWPLHPPSYCCLHAVLIFDCSALLFEMNWVLLLYARPLSLVWHVGGSPGYQTQHKTDIEMTMLNEGMSNKLETKNQLFMMFPIMSQRKRIMGLIEYSQVYTTPNLQNSLFKSDIVFSVMITM